MPCDYRRYPPNWHELSRHIRFVRAKGRCEWCGAVHGLPHPATGSKVVLTVAHLNHDVQDNREENLAALCQRCHLSHDARQHARTRRYGRDWDGSAQTCLAIEEAAR